MNYIDISPLITPAIAVFPGDTPFSSNILLDFKNKDNLLLSSITSTVHLGAHTDAPNHYHPAGEDIASRSLEYYMGKCQVIGVSLPPKARIYPEDISGIEITEKRILFRTSSFTNPDQWHDMFNSLSPELVEYLAGKGVILTGIDTPSVDPADSKDLEAHNSIFRNNMAILEGIILENVADGIYTLIALPLKIKEGDASPVRAVLLPDLKILS
jgi:arylformamidase